jgi:bifunctional DNA-binding transcriptional regulator/antitoxin component of YhaV-PrlF toxin-antitoxin module
MSDVGIFVSTRHPGLSRDAASSLLRHTVEGKAFLPYLCAMTTLTITAKGQITLKKEWLRVLGVAPGDKVDVAPAPDGGLTIRAVEQPSVRTIENLIGCLHDPAREPLSVEDMNNAIGDYVSRWYDQ